MCAGRLSSPACLPLSNLKPNLVAITTWSRIGTERLADQLFVRERSVGFGRVEERDAALEGRADDGNALGTARRLTVAEADPHAAEPDG